MREPERPTGFDFSPAFLRRADVIAAIVSPFVLTVYTRSRGLFCLMTVLVIVLVREREKGRGGGIRKVLGLTSSKNQSHVSVEMMRVVYVRMYRRNGYFMAFVKSYD